MLAYVMNSFVSWRLRKIECALNLLMCIFLTDLMFFMVLVLTDSNFDKIFVALFTYILRIILCGLIVMSKGNIKSLKLVSIQ